MKHYLHKFQDQSAYETAKAGQDFYKPAVSLIDSGMDVIYDSLPVVPEGFIDFGLPSGLLWAQYNLGVDPTDLDSPEDWYGDYYAWGELETKTYYDWTDPNDATQNYKYANGADNKLTKYCNKSEYGNEGYTDELTQLVPEDDVAAVINSAWRMPTQADFAELLAGTTNSWVKNYNNIEGLHGRLFIKTTITRPAFKNITLYSPLTEGEVTDEIWTEMSIYTLEELNEDIESGDIREMMFKDAEMTILAEYDIDYGFVEKEIDSSMFIPASGYRYDSDVWSVGHDCTLWSSSLNFSEVPYAAYVLSFNLNDIYMSDSSRYYGYPVRPVQHIS